MSDTPRTDALLANRRAANRDSDVWDVRDVEAFLKFAKQLERLLDQREKQLIECQHQLITRNAELADALSRCIYFIGPGRLPDSGSGMTG